jgi:hypothetical protein
MNYSPYKFSEHIINKEMVYGFIIVTKATHLTFMLISVN